MVLKPLYIKKNKKLPQLSATKRIFWSATELSVSLWQDGQDGGPAWGWHHLSTVMLVKGQVSGGLEKDQLPKEI